MDKKKQTRKVVPQDWKPPVALDVLVKIWKVLFMCLKIAAGALATILLIVIIVGFVFVGKLGDFLQDDILPDAALDLNDLSVDLNSTIYYIDDQGQFQVQQHINAQMDRKWVSYEEIPEAMINATIAVEDHRFYKHQGVDWVTTLQACARMFFGDGSKGGSTITQQFIKNWTQEDKARDKELTALENDILTSLKKSMATVRDATTSLADTFDAGKLSWSVREKWYTDPDINEVIVRFG